MRIADKFSPVPSPPKKKSPIKKRDPGGFEATKRRLEDFFDQKASKKVKMRIFSRQNGYLISSKGDQKQGMII